jgi:putative membrane protein
MKLFVPAALAAISVGLLGSPAVAAFNDQSFANAAAQGGLAEVAAGQLAEQKAASPQVKQFGQTLVADHTESDAGLQQIAKQKKLTLPTEPSEDQKSEMQKLQGLSGSAFDRQFVQDQIKDHQEDIQMFEQEAATGKDGTLKAYSEKVLPVLRKHLQIAESLASNQH